MYLNDAPFAQVDAGTPEVLTYLHTDHLGTPRFGTNTGGTQVWAWAGDAFGVGAPSGSATINIRMPGQYVDAESGLFYNWNRYYNPAIGRYISSDPIGIDGGLNTFLYADASPVMYVDPEGLQLQSTLQGAQTACSLYPAACRVLLGTVEQAVTKFPATAVITGATAGGYIAGEAIATGIDWCITALTNLEPPGNCTPEEHKDLQERVENACGSAKSCTGKDDASTLGKKIGLHSLCISARLRVNNRCFAGGNKGHQDSVEDRLRAINRCKKLMTDLGK